MLALTLWIFLLDDRPQDITTDRVDVIEMNDYATKDLETGLPKNVFFQVIFWEWNHRHSRYQVVAWRLFKDDMPTPRKIGGKWVMVWLDGNHFRKVTATSYCKTKTWFDPELEDRKILPKERRRGLRRSIRVK